MVSKEAWAMVGGYHHVRHGWEDYDLWARLAEIGLAGEWLPEVLAEYRVHATSMMRVKTLVDTNYRELHRDFSSRHPWVALVDVETRRYPINGDPRLTTPGDRTRLDDLLPTCAARSPGRNWRTTKREPDWSARTVWRAGP